MATDRKGNQGKSRTDDPGHEGSRRAQIRASLLKLLAARPYQELSEDDLIAAAGLPAAEFARHCESLEACFTELCERFMRESAEQTFAAYAAEDNWRDGIRAQIWASYDFLVADHLRARICVIDVNSGGERIVAIRDLFMAGFTELVHLGRHESELTAAVPRERAEAFAGAAWELIAAPIRAGSFGYLLQCIPPILYMLYLPYLGEAAARVELDLARAEAERRSPTEN